MPSSGLSAVLQYYNCHTILWFGAKIEWSHWAKIQYSPNLHINSGACHSWSGCNDKQEPDLYTVQLHLLKMWEACVFIILIIFGFFIILIIMGFFIILIILVFYNSDYFWVFYNSDNFWFLIILIIFGFYIILIIFGFYIILIIFGFFYNSDYFFIIMIIFGFL